MSDQKRRFYLTIQNAVGGRVIDSKIIELPEGKQSIVLKRMGEGLWADESLGVMIIGEDD